MADANTFEAGFHLYDIGGMGDEYGGPRRRFARLFGRLGRAAVRDDVSLRFRVARRAIPTNLPRFRVRGVSHVGLLAMPESLETELGHTYPSWPIRPVVISRTKSGDTLAAPLPGGVETGLARLVIERDNGYSPRVLAVAPADVDTAGMDTPNMNIDTLLYRLPDSGVVPAALGMLVGDNIVAMPRAVINKSPVYSMPLSPQVLDWARHTHTPIV